MSVYGKCNMDVLLSLLLSVNNDLHLIEWEEEINIKHKTHTP